MNDNMSNQYKDLEKVFTYFSENYLEFINFINDKGDIKIIEDLFISITSIIDKYKNSERILIVEDKKNKKEPIIVNKIYECISYFLRGNYYASLEGIIIVEYLFQSITNNESIKGSYFDKVTSENYSEKYICISTIINNIIKEDRNIDYFYIYIYGDQDYSLNIRNKFVHGELFNSETEKINIYSCYVVISLLHILNSIIEKDKKFYE